MIDDLPGPLVPPDVDVRDLDGFMLNVERLMASELVALSSHEVIAGSLFVWCRAWKQIPAASLPDDDRVIAAFSRLSPARYRKLKAEILRGFVKCSDGRLYHRVLAEEAISAFARKSAFRDRRAKDAERLRTWRQKQDRNGHETRGETGFDTQNETDAETRFVREGQGRGGDGTGTGPKEEKDAGPPLRDGAADGKSTPADVISTPQADLFRRGKEILGPSAGGLIRKMLTAKQNNVALARAALEQASQAQDPREYLGAIVAGRDRNEELSARDRGDVW